jgi:hypothetical protein
MVRSPAVRALTASALLVSTAVMAHGQEAAEQPETFGKVYHCKAGPWGDLQYYQVHLEIPDWMINSVQRPSVTPTWYFPGGTQASIRALFQQAELPAALQEYLLDPAHQSVQDGMLTVFPPLPDLIAMTPTQRTIIYSELAKSEVNTSYARPICIANGDPDSWFAQSGLRPELLEMTKKLSYIHGGMLWFSDLGVVLGMAQSKNEGRDIVRTMQRSSSLVLRLNLKASTNVEQVVRYWTADGRNKEIESMLRAAAQTQGNDDLDVIHLLPPLPRRYLYTYYSGEIPIFGTLPNCHWTSLNFFNATPLDYHRDPRLATLHVNEDYTMVPEPYQLGDVLMFVTAAGFPMHSCVYIAADIVYTKNGQSATCPWILMKLGDLKKMYSRSQPITIQGYRLRLTQSQVAAGG